MRSLDMIMASFSFKKSPPPAQYPVQGSVSVADIGRVTLKKTYQNGNS